MKAVPQGKIPPKASAAFISALDFMRMPTNKAATLFNSLDAADAGEITKGVVENVACAYGYELMTFRVADQCIDRLRQLWTDSPKKPFKLSDECKTETLGSLDVLTKNLSANRRADIMGFANIVFAAAGNPNWGAKGFMADQVRNIINQDPFRSPLNTDSRRRSPVFLSPY